MEYVTTSEKNERIEQQRKRKRLHEILVFNYIPYILVYEISLQLGKNGKQ